MARKIYFFMLILCSILSQGILSSEKNIPRGRKKRIVDRTPNGSRSETIQSVPYIVNIHRNKTSVCGGTILSSNNILTAAHCFHESNWKYTVLSGSPYKDSGTSHKIIMKIIHEYFNRKLVQNDLALLIISPPIDLIHSPNRRIKLYEGNLPPNTIATFSGWGCYRVFMKMKLRHCNLQSTTLPVISQLDCQRQYYSQLNITSKYLCTFDRGGQKGCSFGDSGGPLVFDNRLIGVLSWTGDVLETPDIFTNVIDPENRHWILSNMQYVY